METTTAKFRTPLSTKVSDLTNQVSAFINKADQFSNQYNLEIVSEDKKNSLESYKKDYTGVITNLSLRGKKRLAKRIFKAERTMSLIAINKFFNFLQTRFGEQLNLPVIKLMPSKEEQKIILTRDNFKTLRNQFLTAKNDYKNLKSSYNPIEGRYFN